MPPRKRVKVQRLPCVVCKNNCDHGSIQCDACKCWVHAECDGFDSKDLPLMSGNTSYMCRMCISKDDGESYSYTNAMFRLNENMAKKGGEWTYTIYFDPEADKSDGAEYYIKDEELITKMATIVGKDEDIFKVSAYKCPLSDKQITQAILYHEFIIFETDAWFWSIEKNGEQITIQRSQIEKYVKDKYRREDRNAGVTLVKTDGARKMSVIDLIDWLYAEDELNKPYDCLSSNCQIFAKAVFDHLAAVQYL